MTRQLPRLAVALLLSGCAAWPTFFHPASERLGEADALVAQGEYAAALAAYDEVLAQTSFKPVAERAAAGRAAVAAVLAARSDLARASADLEARRSEASRAKSDLVAREAELTAREAELTRLTRELAAREAEVARLRQDVNARQAEIARLTQETERLRADLDQLMKIEMRLERRRP